MSDVPTTPTAPGSEPGIMGSLPKRRPQRPSTRRDTAKNAAKPPARAKAPRAKSGARESARASGARGNAKSRDPVPTEPARAPRQGFEAESDVAPGKAVQPPGGVELAASLVEVFGELAQSGLTSAGKLLRDVLSRD